MEFSLLNLLIVLLIAVVGGGVAQRLGYPALMGEMVAGIVFGPMMLGLIEPSPGLTLLAEVGVFLMMLYIGIEVDHRDLMKASWPGVLTALGAFFIPMAAGYALTTGLFGLDSSSGLFIGLAMGITSLATKSRALMELNLLGTRVANVLLAAALVCDTLALVAFAAITGFAETEATELLPVVAVLGKALLFFGAAVLIGLRLFPLIGKGLRAIGFTERTANFTLVILVGLVFAEMAEIAGLHAIIGAFIAGLFIREEVLKRKVSHEVSRLVHDVSIGFLAPIFFVAAGFHVDISVLWKQPVLLAAITATAFLAKLIGAWAGYAPSRHGWREGLVIGMGMNGQGAVAIIIAEIALKMDLVSQDVFSLLVLMTFFTTAAEPLLLKAGTGWLRRSGNLARADDRRDLVMIAGAGPLARAIAREISLRGKVLLVDNNRNLVQTAVSDGLNAIQGNVLNEELLDVSGAAGTRLFLAMTTNAEVNRLSAEQARQVFGVPQVFVWPTATPPRGPEAPAMLPADAATWNDWIIRKEVERVVVPVETPLNALTLEGLLARFEAMPLAVERGDTVLPVAALSGLATGDRLIALRRKPGASRQVDVFEELIRHCPIIDLDESVPVGAFFQVVGSALSPHVGLDPAEITRLLLRREAESSTVVAPGVAIPHVIIDGDQPIAVLIARCRAGIRFPGEAEADPVQFTFVIIGARSARNLHLRILSAIAQLFQDPAFEDALLSAPDTESMRQVLLQTRRHRF
jgi:Kef-type K+ transport system membrane component KefB/mannitol/fructose-specific phosphotransferase system IIA component (Ntr-type)